MQVNKIYQSDCITGLKNLPDESVDCCVTSPPYYGLRDYGTGKWEGGDPECKHRRDTKNANPDWEIQSRGKVANGVGDEIFKSVCSKCGAVRIDKQIGLEETPEAFVQKMVEVFSEVRRVLKKEGTLWLNLGDSYAGSVGAHKENHKNPGISNSFKRNGVPHFGELGQSGNYLTPKGMKPKDLIGIPWMVAFALRSSGWYLRQDIIWHKPNPMPESVKDRCTKAHEYIFLLSKSAKYYYDADSIAEQSLSVEYDNRPSALVRDRMFGYNSKERQLRTKGGRGGFGSLNGKNNCTEYSHSNETGKALAPSETRNKRSVWTVTTKPFSEAHFATFPEDLIVDCIKAGCPENGIVLDPFMGAGTTALVASKLNRNFIGFELNSDYIEIAKKRLQNELGMFNKLIA